MGNAHVARFDEPWVLLDANELAYVHVLSSYKLFKVMKCRHQREEFVVAKVFVLRDGTPDLQELRKRVIEIREAFRSHWLYPNVVPYQSLQTGAQSAVLLRPFFARNLYDRLHTRPFLSSCEKGWIAFQVLASVCQAHAGGVAHLDLKTENVFISSWNHVVLSDFASFKPLVLPRDDHGEFAFFFESNPPRNRCYLAPERFDAPSEVGVPSGSGGASHSSTFSQPLGAMDVFSLGCVLAELFLDGQALMDLPALRQYRSQTLDLEARVAAIKDPPVEAIIRSMLNLDPFKRKPAGAYLREWCESVAPRAFRSCLLPLSILLLHPVYQQPDMRVSLLRHNFAGLLWQIVGWNGLARRLGLEASADAAATWTAWLRNVRQHVRCIDVSTMHGMAHAAACAASHRTDTAPTAAGAAAAAERLPGGAGAAGVPPGGLMPPLAQPLLNASLCEDFCESLFDSWDQGFRQSLSSGRPTSHEATAAPIYARLLRGACEGAAAQLGSSTSPQPPSAGEADGNAQVVGIVCSLVCSVLQHVKNPRVRMVCLDMLKELAPFAPSFAILEQIVPYCYLLMTDPAAKVRAHAVEVLAEVLGHVEVLPLSDLSLFPEYLFPQLLSSMNGMSGEPAVLLAVAGRIGELARHALRFAEVAVAAVSQRGGAGRGVSGGSTEASPQRPSASCSSGQSPASHAATTHVEVESFDAQWKRIRDAVQKVVKALLEYSPVRVSMPGFEVGVEGQEESEESKLTSAMGRDVKVTLLRNMSTLADVFGKECTLTFLLPYLISFMNDRSWEVRAAFCEEAALLPKQVGPVPSESIIWPLYEQALQDQEERVLQSALVGLALLVRQQVLKRQTLEAIVAKIAPLLLHPTSAVRTRTLGVVRAISEQLSPVDQFVFILPKLRPLLRLQLLSLDALEAALLPPLSRRALKRVLLHRGGSLHKAVLARAPLPQLPGDGEADVADFAGIQPADLAAVDLMRSYLQVMLQSRPSAAQISAAGSLCETAVHLLEYYAVNPHCTSSRSLQALAESDDLQCSRPFTAKHAQMLQHPLGLLSMRAFLAHALCLPPRPRDLGALNYLDGTPYSIYVAAKMDVSGEAKFRSDSLGDSFLSMGERPTSQPDVLGTLDPPLDVLMSSRTSSILGSSTERRWSDTALGMLQGTDMEDRSRGGAGSRRSAWHPQGFLLATLYEYAHKSGVPVVKVDATDDSRILVTGSRDGVVKVWNCGQLSSDMAVSSSHTFTVPGCDGSKRQQCLRALRTVRNSKAAVVGSATGEVLLYRIDRGGQSAAQVCKLGTDAGPAAAVMCVDQFDADLESLVVFARESGAVQGWDLRRDTPCWSVPKVPSWLGVPSCMSLGGDGHSMVVGTLGGGLLVYDLRFLAPWKQWRVASGAAALSMRAANFVPSPSVFVALDSDCNEVALFDVVKGSCSTLFLTDPVVERQRDFAVSVPTLLQARPDLGPSALPVTSPEQLLAAAAAGSSRRATGSVRSLWMPRGLQTYFLAAGADRKVRHWSLDPEHAVADAYVVTPHDATNQPERRDRTTYTSNCLGDVFVVQEQLAPSRGDAPNRAPASPTAEPSGPNPNHRDAILDMCAISLQSDILVTAGRDGLVKLWR